jgi:lysophospholipase L1-like esterase
MTTKLKGCSRSTRAWITAVAIGLVAVVGSVSEGVAGASGGPALEGGYVALGDSVPFGFSPLLEDPWVPARFVGYPELIARQTALTTTNLACPGQTAQAMVSRTAVDNGCFDARRAAQDAGFQLLHTDYSGTQLKAALEAVHSSAPPSLITIQAGGNELSLCLGGPAPGRCLDDALPRVTESLRLAAARLSAGEARVRVVLVGYHLVPGLEAQIIRLNRAIERAAREAHVAFVDTARPFDRYARQHHGDLCTTGLLIVLPDGSCDLHPTRIGQGLIASAVLAAARDDLSSGTA